MAPYTYRALDTQSKEIRLVRLAPGSGDDPVCMSIFHASLQRPPQQQVGRQARDTLAQLQETLPEGYVVKETLDGRYIFSRSGTEVIPTSWEHPVPGFDRARYEVHAQDCLPGPCYEPHYEALSYTWASGLLPSNALVPTSSVAAEIQLGGNLVSALKQLRYEKMPRVLWIDAICINQGDEEERNLQVKRMGLIYSLAQRVVVWLGPEGDDSAHALAALQILASQVELTIDNSLCATPGASEPDWYHPFHTLPHRIFDGKTWSAIESLFRRAWFSRVWVLQEVALANRFAVVHCGGSSLPWLDLRKAIGILRAKQSTPGHIQSILDPQVPGIPPPAMRSLPRLLNVVRRRRCQVPHDKIYGVLSLASPALASLIEPRYNMPASRVLTDVSLAHLQLTHRLELLQFCGTTTAGQRLPEAPSWVPSWEHGLETVLFGLRTGHSRLASGPSCAQYSVPSAGALQVAGVRCAHVKSVGDIAQGTSSSQILDVVRSWEPEGLLSGEHYPPGGGSVSMLDAFLEAVFQGCLRDRFPRAVSWPALATIREDYLALLSSGAGARPGAGADRRGQIEKYLRNGVATGAVFFTTKQGYFGVSGKGVEEGDVVCVILGCDLPLLIRPVNETEDKFRVVGVCFVPGLMDGESLLGPLPGNWRLQMIFRGGFYSPTYTDTSLAEIMQTEDPRLGSLDPNWVAIPRDRTQDDPYFFSSFRDENTGRVINSDPRLLPNALKQRGVVLEDFVLV
ncbi:hypothetical protein OQA88_11030 [Cercophora sp. LCS_1]